MDAADHDRILRTSAERAAVALTDRLDVAVPSCPGWSGADLLGHLARVISFWGPIAVGTGERPTDWVPPERPDEDHLVEWYRSQVEEVADAIVVLDPATPRWTWSRDHTAGFIQRRMAQEFTVHAWDAENAVGEPNPIDAEVAIDGVDEYLDVFLSSNEGALAGASVTVHFHSTDAEGEWMLTLGDGNLDVERTHGKGDVAVRAPASDLLLWLWGRRATTDTGFETFGDADALADVTARLQP